MQLKGFFVLIMLTMTGGKAAADQRQFMLEKKYDEMTQAEHTAAKRTAMTATIRPLVACADPGNMPLSSQDETGIDNRIAKLLAKRMNTTLSFFWRPYLERGLNRETFDNHECDLLLGMPHGYSGLLTTMPIYRSTYVFATRADRNIHIESLDDPQLKNLRIGVYQHSGAREALARHGVKQNIKIHAVRHNTDLVPENQQWRQVLKIVDGELDIAAVWGPFASYVKTVHKAPLVLQPINLMEDKTQLEFSLSIGMRTNDVILKYAMDNAIKDVAAEIEAILAEYGVPLVSCSDCAVQGNLPSHGSYYQKFMELSQKRYLEPLDISLKTLDTTQATPDQVVTLARLEKWLADGADVNGELANAVIASDPVRIKFLVEHGADINRLDTQGYAAMHNAARNRDSDLLQLLLELGADIERRDINGWTSLMHAAFLNHVPSIQLLAEHGADLEAHSDEGYTPLAIAVGEHKFWAAKALLDAGAQPDNPSAAEKMTPLMLLSIHKKSTLREGYLAEGMEPLDLAKMLIEHGADVNAASTAGITPLMVAAAQDNSPIIGLLIQHGADPAMRSSAGKTALNIARDNLSTSAIKTLELLEHFRTAEDTGGRASP